MTAAELFRAGRLTEAVAAQVAAVKSAPADLGLRTFLFELYGFAGDLERAGRQLDVIEQQKTDLGLAVTGFRQCLEAEACVRRVFDSGGAPAFFGQSTDETRRHAAAWRLLHAGQADEARKELAAAVGVRTSCPGRVGDGSVEEGADRTAGDAFADFRDADDLLGPVFEFYQGPDYGWVPIAAVRSLALTPPKRPRDLLWNTATLTLRDGTEHRGVMPVLYPGTHAAADDATRLGRQTVWLGETDGPALGRGMRTFLLDGQEYGMLELPRVTFDAAAEPPSEETGGEPPA